MTTGNTQIGDRPYAWFIVTLCMIAYIFSFIDRQILARSFQAAYDTVVKHRVELNYRVDPVHKAAGS